MTKEMNSIQTPVCKIIMLNPSRVIILCLYGHVAMQYHINEAIFSRLLILDTPIACL